MKLIIKVSEDEELVKEVRKKVKENDGYCPCALIHEPDTKCPCREFRECTKEGSCHCGLYVKIIQEDKQKA